MVQGKVVKKFAELEVDLEGHDDPLVFTQEDHDDLKIDDTLYIDTNAFREQLRIQDDYNERYSSMTDNPKGYNLYYKFSQRVNDLFLDLTRMFEIPLEKFDGCKISNTLDSKDFISSGVSGRVYKIHQDKIIQNDDYTQDVSSLLPPSISTELVVKDFPILTDAKTMFDLCYYSDLSRAGKLKYKSNEVGGETIINDKDYACETESPMLETLLGIIASSNTIFTSPNFLKIHSFSPCTVDVLNKKNQIHKPDYNSGFIFMEYITTSFYKYIESKPMSDLDFDYIIFEVMHAFACMQHPQLELVHYDLHMGNVFLYEYKNDNEKPQVDTLEYVVNGNKFYLDNRRKKFLFKMGDWDRGAKFSHPRLLNALHHEIPGVYPTYYAPAYDIQLFFDSVAASSKKRTPFFEECYKWAFTRAQTSSNLSSKKPISRWNDIDGNIVDIKTINKQFPHVTADNFFKQDFVQRKFGAHNQQSYNVFRNYAIVDYYDEISLNNTRVPLKESRIKVEKQSFASRFLNSINPFSSTPGMKITSVRSTGTPSTRLNKKRRI